MGCKNCLLRFWMYIGGTMHIVIGIAITVLGIMIMTINQDDLPSQMVSPIDTTSYVILGTGVTIFLSGFFGILGGYKNSRCFIVLFSIVALVFLIIFLGIAIGVTVMQGTLKEEIGTQEKCMDFLSSEESAITSTQDYFCNTEAGCQCQIADAGLWKPKPSDYKDGENDAAYIEDEKTYQQLNENSSTQGFQNILDCQDSINEVLKENDSPAVINWNIVSVNSFFLETLEEEFDCSGLCSPLPVYMFSDSNRGPPQNYPNNEGCYVHIYDKVNNLLTNSMIPFWIVAGVSFLNVFLSFCLCCSKKRDESEPKSEQY